MTNQEEHILVANLILIWSEDCVNTNPRGSGKFGITETRLYVPVITLSTQFLPSIML